MNALSGLRRAGRLIGCAAILTVATPAIALNPIDYDKFDGSSPIITKEEFREFFREGDHNIIDPQTDQPLTKADVDGYWDDMIKNKPELRPFLEGGDWRMLGGNLRSLSEQTLQDIESTIHSVIALHGVPQLSTEDLPREGRRMAKALAGMGPDRLRQAVSAVGKMDYYELEAVLQAVGSSVDEMRPMLRNKEFLAQSLRRIPEAGVTLKNFGSIENVVRILGDLRLPEEPQSGLEEPEPVLKPMQVSGVGGVMGVAAPALSIMQSVDPDPSQEPPKPNKNPANDPSDPSTGNVGPGAQLPPPTEPLRGGYDPNMPVNDDSANDGPDADNFGPEGQIPAADAAKYETEENESRADLTLADMSAYQCKTTNVPGATRRDDACLSEDSGDFEKFEGSMKEVNSTLDKIGNIGDVAANVALMAQASLGAAIATSPDMKGAYDVVRATKAQVENFKSLSKDLNALADEQQKAVDAATTEEEKSKQKVTLTEITGLLQQHRVLAAGMERSQQEVALLDDPAVKSAMEHLGTYAGKLGQMNTATDALAKIPSNLEGSSDKVSSLIGAVTGSCPGGALKDVLDAFEKAGETGLSKEDITDTLGTVMDMSGFAGLAKLFTEIMNAAKVIKKVVKFAQNVRTIVNALKGIKDLIEMAQKMDDAKGAASQMAETSSAMDVLRATNEATGENLDMTSLNGAMDAMDKVKEAQRKKKVADCEAAAGTKEDIAKCTRDNQAPPPTQEQFDAFFNSMEQMQVRIAQQQGMVMDCLVDLTQCPKVRQVPGLAKIMDKAESLKGPINTALYAMRVIDSKVSVAVNVSVNINPSALLNFEKYAGEIPKLISKIKGVPSLRSKIDGLISKFAGVFTKLDEIRQQICIRAPNYSIYYCVPPINWPVSQANIYALLNGFMRDNRYKNYRRVGMIPGDIDIMTRLGLPLSHVSYQAQTAVLGFGFSFEPITRGVAGSVPEKAMSVMSTPKVSPLNLNEGWMLRSTCPRTPSTYGWMSDEEDAGIDDAYTDRLNELSDYKLPEEAINNVLTPTLVPTMKSGIHCQPIKPAKKGCDYHGCNPPFFIRLMADSCANQYITSQSLFPTYIADMQSRPSMTPSMCQPLSLVPPDDCMRDATGKCMEDPLRPGVIRHEYDAWRYMERAWFATMVNDYFPAVYFPTINHWDESYIDPYMAEYKEYLKNPDSPNLTQFIHNPHAQIKSPGIDHWYESSPKEFLPKPKGAIDFRAPEYRPQLQDLITHPYERIFDVTHPFTPRWDFETNDRDKYNVCVSMGLNTKPKYCGAKNFWFIPGMNGVPIWGTPVNCASTPVDILRFREKRFDNCIMCRITTNRNCLWSEVKAVPIISVIIEIIRAVLYYIGKALCWGAGVCGDIVVGVADLIFFNPMGHNEAKNLWMVAKKKSDQKCPKKGKKGCRSIIDPIRTLILLLKEGEKGQNGAFSGNPYDQPFLRWITGSIDPFEAAQVDLTAIKTIMKNYVGYDWKTMFRILKTEYRSTWKDTLRPIAKKICGNWFGGKFPQLCFPARWLLRQAFKGVFDKSQNATSTGISKMGLINYCKSDRSKKGRDKYPPCSTSASKPSKDNKYCKEQCKVSIKDCCNEITKPFHMLNILRLTPYTKEERDKNMFAEGTTFEEYFGNHRPFPAFWDTGREWGAVNGKDIDINTDLGSRVRIVGVGTEEVRDNMVCNPDCDGPPSKCCRKALPFEKKSQLRSSTRSCRVGGWGYLASDPTKRFLGDMCVQLPAGNTVHPLTSWTELKMYQMRTYRTTGLNCLGQFEKLHKPNMAEDVALKLGGGFVVQNRGGAESKINWPLAWRGFLWDPDREARFPNFAKRPKADVRVLRGLSSAEPGDIVYLDPEDYEKAYPDRKNARGEPIAGTEYMPFIGVVTDTYNDYSFRFADPENPAELPDDATRDTYTVTVKQGNTGQYPDSCGITEQPGNAHERIIYRRAAQLEKSTGNTGTRLKGLTKLQECLKNGSGCATTDKNIQALMAAKQPFQVFNTRCQADPMTRACSFEDPRVTAKNMDLWDMVRIYRPYGSDYRGGCMVRPNAKATKSERVDISTISHNDMHRVPEEDVMGCIASGYDTPPGARYEAKNADRYEVNTDVRGPGYNVTLPAQLKTLGMQIIGRIGLDPQSKRLLKNFPEMAQKPYIGFTSIPRYRSNQFISLAVDASVRVDTDSPHNGSLLKPGLNALGPLYQFAPIQDFMWKAEKVTNMTARGELNKLYAGGAAQLGKALSTPANAGFNPRDGIARPIEAQRTTTGPEGLSVGDVEIILPSQLDRASHSTGQDVAEAVPDIAITKYPGYAIRGLSGDAANLIIPPCADPNPKDTSVCPKIKIDGVGKLQVEQGSLKGPGTKNRFDGDFLITTPPDTQIQVPAGVERNMTFPYGVSFRVACKDMVELSGYARVHISKDGKLVVTKGEKAADKWYYDLAKEQKDNKDFHVFMPVNGYSPEDGATVQLDIGKDLIPATNVLPSSIDESVYGKSKPAPSARPYDGMDGQRMAYNADDMPGTTQEEIDKMMKDADDVCHTQDEHQCPANPPPGGTTQADILSRAGISFDNPQMTPTPLVCELEPNSDACVAASADPCAVYGGASTECKEFTDFCASQTTDPQCSAVATCKDKLSSDLDANKDGASDFAKCMEDELGRCDKDPSGPGCNSQDVYCQSNPASQMCAASGGDDYCAQNPTSSICSGANNADYCTTHPDDFVCQRSGSLPPDQTGNPNDPNGPTGG